MAGSTYKLNYFDLAGLGESIRFIFSFAGVDFEDNRVAKEDWPAIKESYPFHQMPALEVDGKMLLQSTAIARFLGKRFGLVSSDPIKDAQLEAVVDHVKDLSAKLRAEFLEKTPEKIKESSDAIEFTFTRLDAMASEGYFYGSEPSWVDVYFTGMMETVDGFRPGVLQPYPNLLALSEKVKSNEGVQKYMASRPKAH